jgi:hypothetical protein
MKKITIGLLTIVSVLTFYSCQKISSSKIPINSTTTVAYDIKNTATAVTLSQATQVAIKFLQSKNTQSVFLKNAVTIVNNGKTYFHVINANTGFVVLASDSMYLPIIAYDKSNNFSTDFTKTNAGIALWINKHANQLDYLRNTRNNYTDSIASVNKNMWQTFDSIYFSDNSNQTPFNSNRQTIQTNGIQTNGLIGNCQTFTGNSGYWTTIGPLCSTHWNQTFPFNEFCPVGTYSNGHVPAGCVPVAMAQILHFWNTPTTYNHGIMPNAIETTPYFSNSNGWDEVGRLVHDIGTTQVHKVLGFQSQFASYSDGGTSADDTYCPNAFDNFGLHSASRSETISDQSLYGRKNGTSYAGLLVDEISTNRRPCIVSGYSGINKPWYMAGIVEVPNGDGHSWVCDGLQQFWSAPYVGTACMYSDRGLVITKNYPYGTFVAQGFLHMNWGWGLNAQGGSNGDGWYDYSVNYTMSPHYPTPVDFQYFQTIIYNIHP